MARYGHQDIFRLLGRDPMTEPLTPVEMLLFTCALQDHVSEERKPFDAIGAPMGEDD